MFSPQKTLLTTALLSSALLSQGAIANTQQDCRASFDGVRLTVPCISAPELESTFAATFVLTEENAEIVFSLFNLEETIRDFPTTSLQGIFVNRGYGQILEIGDGVFSLYDFNRQTCTKFEDNLPVSFFSELYPTVLLHADGSRFDTLPRYNADESHPFTYQQIDALPLQCQQSIDQPVNDFTINFEALWHSFNDNYPLFNIKQVDWQEIYEEAKPRLRGVQSDLELLALFGEMIKPMNDGHVSVKMDDDNEVESATLPPNWILRVIEVYRAEQGLSDLQTAFATQQQFDDFEAFFANLLNTDAAHEQFLQGQQIISNYVADLDCPIAKVCSGTINPQVAYISIRAMSGYGPTGEDDPEQDIAFIEQFLDQLMPNLADKQAVIIDIRRNGGGFEPVSLAIASRFNAEEQIAFHKKAKFAEGFANQQSVVLEAAEQPFTKPVYVLTNEESASAAEGFILMLRQLPHVTVIGETTPGILSTKVGRVLPNGWEFFVPSEVHSDLNGQEYEGVGIPADIESLFWLPADVQQGRDDGIEQALRLFNQG